MDYLSFSSLKQLQLAMPCGLQSGSARRHVEAVQDRFTTIRSELDLKGPVLRHCPMQHFRFHAS